MTPRDVLYQLPYDTCCELTAIGLERMNPAHAADMLIRQYGNDELAEIGLRIKEHLAPGGA